MRVYRLFVSLCLRLRLGLLRGEWDYLSISESIRSVGEVEVGAQAEDADDPTSCTSGK